MIPYSNPSRAHCSRSHWTCRACQADIGNSTVPFFKCSYGPSVLWPKCFNRMSGAHRCCTYPLVCLCYSGPFIVGYAHKNPAQSYQMLAPAVHNLLQTLLLDTKSSAPYYICSSSMGLSLDTKSSAPCYICSSSMGLLEDTKTRLLCYNCSSSMRLLQDTETSSPCYICGTSSW